MLLLCLQVPCVELCCVPNWHEASNIEVKKSVICFDGLAKISLIVSLVWLCLWHHCILFFLGENKFPQLETPSESNNNNPISNKKIYEVRHGALLRMDESSLTW